MFKRLLQSMMLGTAAYIIVVLIGLVSFQPLPVIFWRGLRMLLGGTLAAFLLLNLAAIPQEKKDDKDNRETELQNSAQRASEKYQENAGSAAGKNESTPQNQDDLQKSEQDQENNAEENEDEFSPLDPPVLETED